MGLASKAVEETKERVKTAIINSDIEFPTAKITVNLAPADLQKEGSHFDLALALGILIEMGILSQIHVENFYALGELSLDGSITSVSGIISAAIGANQQKCGIICPAINGREAAWAGDLPIIAAPDLISLINHCKGEQFLAQPVNNQILREPTYPDLSDIKGQETAKRALEIAAAGGHNLLLIGPPGTGKSMLASRLAGILPPPDLSEILEINMIHSISGKLEGGNLITSRPYRDPHHSCSMPAMIGGGAKAKPGEVSLACNGVLFLDELAEFPRQVLDSLRQPLETGSVSVSRVNSHITYPATFQLVAAMNPCRCGYLGDGARECKKAPICGEDYKNKISGPLFDRIDMVVEVPQIDIFFSKQEKSENSASVKRRVIAARELQKMRYQNEEEMSQKINARINGQALEKFTSLNTECEKILKKYIDKMSASMRGITRVLRVARSIADLERSENIAPHHLLEAISYRRKL